MAWKGIGWGILFFIDGLIFSTIPTYLIFTHWKWLNSLTYNGEPIYTFSLFVLFLWIVSILLCIIYFVASVRAIYQRKNEDLGISKGVKIFGAVSAALVIAFMVFWYFFDGSIAFFSWQPPPVKESLFQF
jgi:glucan phosphoethanolaminetransferase (alkaline phosphatase superfamily)